MKGKLLAFAVLATLVPALALGLLSFWRYQSLIGEEIAYELRTLAADASEELLLWERERAGELRTLATSYAVVGAVQAGAKSEGVVALEGYLRSVQKRLGTLLELTVVDAEGRTIASSAATPVPVILPANWTGSTSSDVTVMGPARRDPARGTAIVTIVAPVVSARNEVDGAMAAVLDFSTVAPRLQLRLRSARPDVTVLASDGTPLLGAHGEEATPDALPRDVLARLRAQPGTMLNVRGHRQRDVLAVAEEPAGLPFVVVAEADRASVYEAWVQALQRYLWLVAALTLAVGVGAYALARSIVRPLNRLIAAADQVRQGDYSIELPVTQADEVGYLTRMFNTMTSELRRSESELRASGETLRRQNELLARLSVTDGLTGLFNRPKLESVLADEFARFRRTRHPFTVLMLDIDSFKAINDTHGHAAGDAVLVALGKVLTQAVRSIDFVGRYGGEEFVVVLVDTTADAALDVAERIRAQVQTARIAAGAAVIPVTASVGIAQIADDDASPEALLARADAALYAAKHAGRNRVRQAS